MSLNQSFISDFSEYYRWPQRTKIKYKLHYGWYMNGAIFRGWGISIALKLLYFLKIIFKSNILGLFELGPV